MPPGWTTEHVARALVRYTRKRESNDPPEDGDESDTEYHRDLHKKGRRSPKRDPQQEKNYKILLEKLRLHFARFLSANDDEIFDMMEASIHVPSKCSTSDASQKIYAAEIKDDSYWRLEESFLRIKEKAKSVARQWQKLMLNAIEVS